MYLNPGMRGGRDITSKMHATFDPAGPLAMGSVLAGPALRTAVYVLRPAGPLALGSVALAAPALRTAAGGSARWIPRSRDPPYVLRSTRGTRPTYCGRRVRSRWAPRTPRSRHPPYKRT